MRHSEIFSFTPMEYPGKTPVPLLISVAAWTYSQVGWPEPPHPGLNSYPCESCIADAHLLLHSPVHGAAHDARAVPIAAV